VESLQIVYSDAKTPQKQLFLRDFVQAHVFVVKTTVRLENPFPLRCTPTRGLNDGSDGQVRSVVENFQHWLAQQQGLQTCWLSDITASAWRLQ